MLSLDCFLAVGYSDGALHMYKIFSPSPQSDEIEFKYIGPLSTPNDCPVSTIKFNNPLQVTFCLVFLNQIPQNMFF